MKNNLKNADPHNEQNLFIFDVLNFTHSLLLADSLALTVS